MVCLIDNPGTIKRLNEWLEGKGRALPSEAKLCLENFVLSCNYPTKNDEENFACLDIVDYPLSVQAKLIEGFRYAYYESTNETVIPTESAFYVLKNVN